MREMIESAIKAIMKSITRQNVDLAKDILSISNDDLQIVNHLFSLIVPIALIAMVAYWLEGYLEMTTAGREVSKDQLSQSLIWLAIGFFVMQNIYFLTSTFAGIFNKVLEDFYDIVTGLTNDKEFSMNSPDLADFNVIVLIIALAVAIVAWFINIISQLVLSVTCLSTKIELILRFCLIPIGVTPLANATYKSDAIRFLKKTLATAFYGGVILVIIYIANISMANVESAMANGNGFGNGGGLVALFRLIYPALTNIVSPFAAIGAISTAKTLTNEAFGG